MELTHASFFSGVGGLDHGLERAGWRTVSFSEIDDFPSAVLRSRWANTPNLGDITDIESRWSGSGSGGQLSQHPFGSATLWSGGFPCQDLSIAGKRRGFEGQRSSLAFTFLGLVEKYRPPWLLLENVVGLLSSNNRQDFRRLLSEMDELGYGVAWRVFDARYFGVAQRRRRVFIVGSLGSDRAGAVLSDAEGSEGSFVPRLAARSGNLASVARSVTASSGKRHDDDTDTLIPVVAATINSGGNNGGFRTEPGEHLIAVGAAPYSNGVRAPYGMAGWLDNTNPAGMDTARYKAIGNGVVSPVAEWIGRRLRTVV